MHGEWLIQASGAWSVLKTLSSLIPGWPFNLSSNGDPCKEKRGCYNNFTRTIDKNVTVPANWEIWAACSHPTLSPGAIKSLLYQFFLGPDFCSGVAGTLHSFRSFIHTFSKIMLSEKEAVANKIHCTIHLLQQLRVSWRSQAVTPHYDHCKLMCDGSVSGGGAWMHGIQSWKSPLRLSAFLSFYN